jgi:hypothetical protein
LFELCSEALRTGKRGRPKKTLRQGVKVRLKNSLPHTFFLLNGDMELNKNRQIFVNNIL